MAGTRLGWARLASVAGLSALGLGLGLGGSGRLTYHEAFVAQGAREMIARGAVLVPTIGGRPWLEKPPLALWLVALAGRISGGVDEAVARAPSAVAATLLALGVATFAARRFGRDVGWLAGLVQATTAWLVIRGRLAEADILLACLVTWSMVAFDRLRAPSGLRTEDSGLRTQGSAGGVRGPHAAIRPSSPLPREADDPALSLCLPSPLGRGAGGEGRPHDQRRPGLGPEQDRPTLRTLTPTLSQREREEEGLHRASSMPSPAVRLDPGATTSDGLHSPAWRWAFFACLGATALVKGVGFGAVLVGSSVATVLIWDRDRAAARALMDVRGWAVAAILALTWPALVAWRLPAAVSLWTLHVTDRLASHPEHFIGGPWWQYGPSVLGQALPWTPLALAEAWPSLRRAWRGRGGVDRLLWAWAVVPVLVLSAATVKNAHYAIHALPPLAVWAALGLARVGHRLVVRRGWSPRRVRISAFGLFAALGLGSGLGHLALGPRFDQRGPEWAWYGEVGRSLEPGLPLVFLYEDWDRKPYPTPFGPVPHDWAVRLFYLGRPASWRQGVDDLAARPPSTSPAPYALLGRDRDLPALRKLGRVEAIARGPYDRFDRDFTLFLVTPR